MVIVNADVTVERLTRWAQARDEVRALILTSTRVSRTRLDAYSDYDVIAIVRDVRPMLVDTRWQPTSARCFSPTGIRSRRIQRLARNRSAASGCRGELGGAARYGRRGIPRLPLSRDPRVPGDRP